MPLLTHDTEDHYIDSHQPVLGANQHDADARSTVADAAVSKEPPRQQEDPSGTSTDQSDRHHDEGGEHQDHSDGRTLEDKQV